eukprot:scaffold10506_cov462-Chaetoceros_neogracile.AAC.1
MTANQAIATTAVAVVPATLGWVRFSSSRWISKLKYFRRENHRYATLPSGKNEVLFVVCPLNGDGKTMDIFS